jgi:hypothetical protein
MSIEKNDLISELQKISADALEKFGSLSSAQTNWRPSAEGWSVGQCFEHLIKANEMFYGDLDKIGKGTRRNSFLENYSPLSGFFGSLLVNSLKKDERKFKAPTQKIVPPSEIDVNIVEIFAGHQAELIEKIKRTQNVNPNKIKVTSPFMKLVTYKLSDGFQVIVEHEKRHLRQAEKVMQTSGFPR